jgi:dipeptidyl aminopeptidase/acylaminoacyl peptidase
MRSRYAPASLLLLLPISAAVLVAAADTAPRQSSTTSTRLSIDAVLDRLDTVNQIRETAISSDGTRVAWVVDVPTASGGGSAIYVRDLPSGPPRRVSASTRAGGPRERGISWSPDGRALAFLSDAAGGHQLQLYVASPAGAAPRKITDAIGQLAHPIWSPDGKRLALLYVAGSTQETGALVAYKPDAGVVGDAYDEQRIAVVDAAGGPLREVSPADLFVYDYDWSPDGQTFAAEAVKGSGTNNYWVAELYLVRADTGAARSIWKPPFQIAWPRWSPDGTSIAVIHGIMSDEGSNGGDVYLVPADGGPARNFTPKLTGSVRSLAWHRDGHLVLDEYSDGQTALVRLDEAGNADAANWLPQQITAVSVARNVDAASGVAQTFTAAPEVYAGARGPWVKQTSINASVRPMWGSAKSLHWKSDTVNVQGWLLAPQDIDPTRTYPLVVSVHGGPSSAHMATWPARWNAVLPTQGYFVLLANPRGSYGSGEAFTQGNIKDFGYGDWKDILGGVDAAIAAAPIDPARLGLVGWSYGGYMTMWGVTQTTRFKAAVAGAGIANWQSYYGQNKIDTWMLPFFGASVYDDPAVYARSSPITFIKQVRTPTLVLHGDRDSEVPTPQGYEFWHALKALGVPTELVIYPDEGHAIAKPEHQHDIQKRLVAWFDKYLTPSRVRTP